MTGKGQVRQVALAISLALASVSGSAQAKPSLSADAIIGGDRSAIIGGDRSAIIGGDARKTSRSAIIGGDRSAIIGGDRSAIIGGDARKTSRSSSTIAFGPIESVDIAKGQISVLGQSFRPSQSAAALSDLARTVASGQTVLAYVAGNLDAQGGVHVQSVTYQSRGYVPGNDSVVIVGRVDSVDSSVGTLSIGSLKVDYTSMLSTGHISVKPGTVVAVIGTQSASGTAMQASQIDTLAAAGN